MRMTLFFFGVFVLVAGPALMAQEADEDPRERYLRWTVDRLKSSLELTDQQGEEILEVLRESRQQQDDKVREVLTEEQKAKFEGVESATRLSSRRRGTRSFAPMAGPSIDAMKEQLGLSDEQVEKIEPLVKDFTEKLQKRMEELREGGFQNLDWRKEMERGREQAEKLREAVNEFLTDEQKEKVNNFFQAMGSPRGGFSTRTRSDSQDSFSDRVMTELAIEDKDEAAAIKALIDKVNEARNAYREASRVERDKVREMLEKKDVKDEDVGLFLEEIRAKRMELEKAIRNARNELREVVSYRQELILLRWGLLE